MDYEVLHRPAYAVAQLRLEPGESIQAEPGAMITMSDGIKLTAGVRGGLFQGMRRKMLGGESFFISRFTSEGGGELGLAPPLAGDI